MDKIERIGNSIFAIKRYNYRIEPYTDLDRQGIIYEGNIRSDFRAVPYKRPVWDRVEIVKL